MVIIGSIICAVNGIVPLNISVVAAAIHHTISITGNGCQEYTEANVVLLLASLDYRQFILQISVLTNNQLRGTEIELDNCIHHNNNNND